MGNIKIEKMVLGMVQTNTWFVINEKTKELILIDPGRMMPGGSSGRLKRMA